MKKLLSLLFMTAIIGFVFTGCDKEEPAANVAPLITDFKLDGTAAADSGYHTKGDTLLFSFVASDAEGLKSYLIEETTSTTSTLKSETVTGGSASVSYSYVVSSSLGAGTVITLTFTVTDDAEQTENKDDVDLTTSETYIITVKNAATPLSTEVTTGALYHIAGANGCTGAYDLVLDAKKASADAEVDKDMKNTDLAGSAFTGSWESDTTSNGTLWVKSNSYDYANATVESAATAYYSGTGAATVTNPAKNDIYIAKLRGGTIDYAVIKITDILPDDVTCNSATTNKGMMTFSYKKK